MEAGEFAFVHWCEQSASWPYTLNLVKSYNEVMKYGEYEHYVQSFLNDPVFREMNEVAQEARLFHLNLK